MQRQTKRRSRTEAETGDVDWIKAEEGGDRTKEEGEETCTDITESGRTSGVSKLWQEIWETNGSQSHKGL